MNKFLCIICFVTLIVSTGCVHELPNSGSRRDVLLHITHAIGWTYHDMTVTRGDIPAYVSESPESGARYHIQVFTAGDRTLKLYETEVFNLDMTRSDFTTTLSLPPGEYDLYVWSDYAAAETQNSYFFHSDDFSSIYYSDPYNGNNELRDAFRGMVSFTVDANIDDNYYAEAEVELERPLSRYEFVSTDLAEFITAEETRTKGGIVVEDPAAAPSRLPLEQYRILMKYTGYMPSIFNNFTNRPVNSATGIEYEAKVVKLNDNEARLGFDYVMVNGRESSIKVALEIYDPTGELVGRTHSVDVVTKRGMNTTVRGKFLTSQVSGGVGIDPSFNGEFNVPIQ